MAPPVKSKAGSAGAQSFATQPPAVKVAVAIFVAAGLGALYYFALHAPMDEAIASANVRYVQLQDEMQQAEMRQREYIRLREELAAREGLDRANMRVLPAEAEIPSFLQDLNRLAETSGLHIRFVEPRPEEPDVHYVRVPVALRLSGRYHQLARFFYNVSRLERAISMENIRLGEPRRVDADTILDVQVLATTYRRPSEEESAAARAAAEGGG
jgi:type IV pilus assembly protein PilO